MLAIKESVVFNALAGEGDREIKKTRMTFDSAQFSKVLSANHKTLSGGKSREGGRLQDNFLQQSKKIRHLAVEIFFFAKKQENFRQKVAPPF